MLIWFLVILLLLYVQDFDTFFDFDAAWLTYRLRDNKISSCVNLMRQKSKQQTSNIKHLKKNKIQSHQISLIP